VKLVSRSEEACLNLWQFYYSLMPEKSRGTCDHVKVALGKIC
jgi:hypothetical protein